MQIHELKLNHRRKTKKRVGRGGKRGTTSGRGTKGQKARSGNSIRPAVRDLLQRMPKLRGHKNNPKSPSKAPINLADLSKVEGDIINKETLVKARLVRASQKGIKILGTGEVTKALTVNGLILSETAKKKIEAAGGSINEKTS